MDAALFRARRVIAILCLLALLVAALTPATSGLLFAILSPLLFFFAALVVFQVRIAGECTHLPRRFHLPVFASRPPPAR